jgi:tRNA A37 threonylcarbamoyladenosine biosynthesis protein TsaE
VFVEWPEAGAGTLPPERARVTLAHVAPERRRIHVDAPDDALLQALDGC